MLTHIFVKQLGNQPKSARLAVKSMYIHLVKQRPFQGSRSFLSSIYDCIGAVHEFLFLCAKTHQPEEYNQHFETQLNFLESLLYLKAIGLLLIICGTTVSQ